MIPNTKTHDFHFGGVSNDQVKKLIKYFKTLFKEFFESQECGRTRIVPPRAAPKHKGSQLNSLDLSGMDEFPHYCLISINENDPQTQVYEGQDFLFNESEAPNNYWTHFNPCPCWGPCFS